MNTVAVKIGTFFLLLMSMVTHVRAQGSLISGTLSPYITNISYTDPSDSTIWPGCDPPENIVFFEDEGDSSISITWDDTLQVEPDYEYKFGNSNQPEENWKSKRIKQKKFKIPKKDKKGKKRFKLRRICEDEISKVESEWVDIDLDFNSSVPDISVSTLAASDTCDCNYTFSEIQNKCVPTNQDGYECVYSIFCEYVDKFTLIREPNQYVIRLVDSFTQQDIDNIFENNISHLNLQYRYYSNYVNYSDGKFRHIRFMEIDPLTQQIVFFDPNFEVVIPITRENLYRVTLTYEVGGGFFSPGYGGRGSSGCPVAHIMTDWRPSYLDTLTCDNGRDDDGDGIIDCDDPDCVSLEDEVVFVITQPSCFIGGRIDVRIKPPLVGDNICKEFSFDGGNTYQSDYRKFNLPPGSYNVDIRYQPSGLVRFAGTVVLEQPNCDPEICNNGIDDDGDRLPDCFDSDCGVFIQSVSITHPLNCPNKNNGLISIIANGNNLEYSVDGGSSYQASNSFANLSPGTYTIQVRNMTSLCIDDYGVIVLNDTYCPEICDNGIDDNGNGLIDCEDPECIEHIGFSGTSYQHTSNDTCANSSDGYIELLASGIDLMYSIDSGFTYASSFLFDSLSAGTYYPVIKINSSSCEYRLNPIILLAIYPCTDPACVYLSMDSIGTNNPSKSNCPVFTDGSITLHESLEHIVYSIDGGLTFQDSKFFSGLDSGSYQLVLRDTVSGCESRPVAHYVRAPSCPDICNNTLDDDGDGLVDCADPDCIIFIDSIEVFEPSLASCPIQDDGFMVVHTQQPGYFSIDNGLTFQASNAFNNLLPGVYQVIPAKDTLGSCAGLPWTIQIDSTYCLEDCTNGMDDNGDGLIDCDDPDCNIPSIDSISLTDPTIAYCPTSNDGTITVFASGTQLRFSIDSGMTYQTSNHFTALDSGLYYVAIKNNTSGCAAYGSAYLNHPNCGEICDNGIDDDGDGLIDCADPDCLLPQFDSSYFEVPSVLSCPDVNTGLIELYAIGSNLEYSIDGGNNYQDSSTFVGVGPGTYYTSIRNAFSLCSVSGDTIHFDPISCPEVCDNGLDDDLDGLIDCADPDCDKPFIDSIQVIDATLTSCPQLNDGQIHLFAFGNNLKYSIDNAVSFQNEPIFINLTAGDYIIVVKDSVSGCFVQSSVQINAPNCSEICDNGLDDDGDGLIDCEDGDCGKPEITEVVASDPSIASCPDLDNGQITIVASGNHLKYSIDAGSTYQVVNQFSNLTAGIYQVVVINDSTQCATNSLEVELFAPGCLEICDNNLDDDGDGFIDCADPDCNAPVINQVNTSKQGIHANPNCDLNIIEIIASGSNLLYSIDDGNSYTSNNLFENLPQNIYFAIVMDSVSGCESESEFVDLLVMATTEQCENGIDDDCDGLVDCDDPDCPIGLVDSAVVIHPSCPSLTDGVIEIIHASTANHFYSIDGGSTFFYNQPIFDSLPVGQYTVVIKPEGFEGSCPSDPQIVTLSNPGCVEICDNGLDDNGNGLIDCEEITCFDLNTPISVSILESACDNLTGGSIAITFEGIDYGCVEYSIDGGATYSSQDSFAGLSHGLYEILVRNKGDGRQISGGPVLLKQPICGEICDNGLDDDGDGHTDCEDGECAPAIIDVTILEETCLLPNSGSITIEASGGNLKYSIDNGSTYQDQQTFSNLSLGTYLIVIKNNLTGCITLAKEVVLRSITCGEICNNGKDDDGDGLIDCADGDCADGFTIMVDLTQPTSLLCPNANDGNILITSSDADVEYSIDGGETYQSSNSFSDLFPGEYEVIVRHSLSQCVFEGGTHILLSPACTEICDNGLDDDGDGLSDCDDPDCANSSTLNAEICTLTDYFYAQPLANNQALIYVDSITQTEFESIFLGTNQNSAILTASYLGINGPVSESRDLFEIGGDSVKIETWSFVVYDILYDSAITLTIEQFTGQACPLSCSNSKIVSVPIVSDTTEILFEENPEIELPDFNCGDIYTPSAVDSTTDLNNLQSGEIFFVSGFPILVGNVQEISKGEFSGDGIVPLPFNKKTLQVTFNNVRVNKDRQIWSGDVIGIPGSLMGIDFTPDTFSVGGEICLPPPPKPGYDQDGFDKVTGLNEWGFDSTGVHSETGTTFDPNGFDVSGIHEETGTEYNPGGCNREGRDENDNPCDPGGATSPQVAAFIDTIKDKLPQDVSGLIDSILIEKQNELLALSTNCSKARTSIDSLLIILGYDRSFILGDGDKYFQKGMSSFFEKRPEALIQNVDRNPSTIALENKHIQLFDCDQTELLTEALITELATIQAGDQSALVQQILDVIKKLPKEVVATFSDPAVFKEWLAEEIQRLLLQEESVGSIEEELFLNPINQYKEKSSLPQHAWYSLVASVQENNPFLGMETPNSVEELDFEFRQGFKYIKGVHRAFYLEAIAQARSEAPLFMESQGVLPITVSKIINGKEVTIYLDNILISDQGARCDAYLILDDLQNKGNRLVFEGLNIGFGPTGLMGTSVLSLISQVELKLSNTAKLILNGGGTNFVEWDCNGFVGLNLDAQVELCRNFVIPLDPGTLEPKPEPELYRVSFSTYIDNWFDFTIGIDAPPFMMAGAENIKWEIDSMFIDMSDGFTPTFATPFGYNSPYVLNDGRLSPLWRGFYVCELSSTFPNQFSQDSSDITVGVNDLMIDGCGVSAQIFVEDLITFDEGDLGGWPFSIDRLNLQVLHNHIAGGGFGGMLNVPVFESNMRYEAIIYPGERYEFVVTPNEKDTMSLFLAEAVISENSKIDILYEEGDFLAVATLSGSLRMKSQDTARINFSLPELHFCDFRVSNQAPYFDAGRWSIKGADSISLKIAGFGMDLSNITPIQGDTVTEAGIGFDLGITLADALGLSASGRLAILGELTEENNRQKWRYKKTQIKQVYIEQNIKDVCAVKGFLEFYDDDPDYGEGFYGLISADFIDLGIKVDASGQFGKKDDYKYFFVDAMADLPIAIGAGPVNITGFGGGLSYHMDSNFDLANITFANGIPVVTPAVGVSFSGVTYTPSETLGIGVKASALLASAKEEIFNGSISIEFIFNTIEAGGGLHKLAIRGNGHFLKPIDLSKGPKFIADTLTKPDREAALSAYLDLELNFTDSKFSGDLSVFLYAAGGIVRGAGTNNRLCAANILFSPTEWYINIGTPSDRCGILVQVPLIGSAKLTAYLDVGSTIPDFPELPDNVKSLAYKVKSNEGLRKSGAGIIFGAALDININSKFGPASGFLNAGLGFDIMLRNYGGAQCLGSNEPVGIDGWYAAGQMWGYLEGGVKLFGVPILEAGIAAVFQARLPNPFWAQATLAVKVKVLFVKATINVPIELGEFCILVSNNPNDLIGLQVISHTNPLDGTPDNLTDIQPEVYFSIPLNQTIELPNGSGTSDKFFSTIKDIELVTKDQFSWPVSYKMSEDNMSAMVIPGNLLPAFDSITMITTVEIRKNGSFFAEESDTTSFLTGAGFDYIPATNVEYAYPVDGMYNFYKNEYNRQEGFIKLVSGQPDLLVNLNDGSINKVKITSAIGGNSYLAEIVYDPYSNKITFPLDPGSFVSDQLCHLTLVNESPDGVEKEIYSGLYFRVSEYHTFKDKLVAIQAGMDFGSGSFGSLKVSAPIFGKIMEDELFGQSEIDGELIKTRADINTTWFNEKAIPLIYDRFPFFDPLCGTITYQTSEEEFDLKDAAGIQSNNIIPISVGQDQFNVGSFEFDARQRVLYTAANVAANHHNQLKSEVNLCIQLIMTDLEDFAPGPDMSLENEISDIVPPELSEFIESPLPPLTNGNYRLLINYQLPDGTKTTYNKILLTYQNSQN